MVNVEKYLNEGKDNILKSVKEFLDKQNTWFEDDDSDDELVKFITRKNGDVGSERPGMKDIKEGKRLVSLLRKKFGNEIKIYLDKVDEWVEIEIIGGK